jgi:hypothetical protein
MSANYSRTAIAALVTVSLTLALSQPAWAQRRAKFPVELRGSPESVEKMYDFALANGLPFYLTPTNVDRAVSEGKLVPLNGDSTYELTQGVGFSYATREARQFVLAFAPQYLSSCGVPLMVTSAARPTSRQPHNANPHSVHPTGIAVDLRRPSAGPCQTWVRTALAELERRGIVEATEERNPVHIHVAVMVRPGDGVVLPNLVNTVVARVPTAPAASVAHGSLPSAGIGLPKGIKAAHAGR